MTRSAAAGTDLVAAVDRAHADGRLAVTGFLTAGFPDPDGFGNTLSEVAEVADIVEVGVPFTDPLADGVTIQAASHAALTGGVSLRWILDLLAGRAFAAPVVLMSYLNPLLAFGLSRVTDVAKAAGVAGFIVPDLPLEESEPFRDLLDASGLALVQLVSPVTPPDRMVRICRASRGFVYAVTVTGTTGGTAGALENVGEYLARVRDSGPLPVQAGFGIRTPDQVQALRHQVDGFIVGSALLEVLERGDNAAEYLRTLKDAGTLSENRT